MAFGRNKHVRFPIDRSAERRLIQEKRAAIDRIIMQEIKLVANDPEERRRLAMLEEVEESE